MMRPTTNKSCMAGNCALKPQSTGKTAYEIAVEQGFIGSEIEWIKYQEGVNAELSKTQADRAESEADRAQGIADNVEILSDTAIAEADRSRDEADRAETEANKAQVFSETSVQAAIDSENSAEAALQAAADDTLLFFAGETEEIVRFVTSSRVQSVYDGEYQGYPTWVIEVKHD